MKRILITALLFGYAALALAAEEKPWNVQKTPEHIYRVVWISYSALGSENEMGFSSISPPS